jgi:nitrite reductase/ring-hydroxylating ferredoxin subunit
MGWVKAASLADLREKPIVFRQAPLQVALFAVDEQVFAVDNRCPHEGYPLAMGKVSSDCVLTCNWHNWKFRLEDGACVLGGDNVRSYPTRLQNDEVWIDLTPPPPEQIRQQILNGLRTAFHDRDFGRICREIARLNFHALDPKDAVREGIRWSYDRFEYGTDHAYAGAADWLALADTFKGDLEKQLICFSEAVDHMAFDSLRRPQYPYGNNGEPFELSAFLAAVEAEQPSRAESMVTSALASGKHWADLEEIFATAALAHYNDFGHSVIYVQKIAELLGILGGDVERFLLLPLTRSLCYAVRDDLIPDFKDYATMLTALPEPRTTSAVTTSLEVPFPSNLSQAFQWLKASLSSHDVNAVYDALLTALAQNLLHYDTEYGSAFDRPVTSSVSWLGFTHGITFSHGVRFLCSRYPQLWRAGLLQMACFVARNFRYLDRNVDLEAWRVSDSAAFFAETYERLMDHGINEPIFAVHLLKTSRAVEMELPFASPACREVLLASLNRFLHSSIKMKHVRRLARQAIALVSRDFE